MIDLDELIAEARDQAAYLRGVSRDGSMPYSGELLKSLADALESVRAERDAALAAIGRVRAFHGKEPVNANYGGTRNICLDCDQSWPCQTAVALGLNEGEN